MAYEDPDLFGLNDRPNNHRQDTDGPVYRAISPVPTGDLKPHEADQLRGAALVWLNRGAGHRPLYLKTHCANVTLDRDLALIPKVLTDSVLYLIRDPRDIAVSFADHLGEPVDKAIEMMGDPARVIRRDGIRQVLTTWSHHVRSWTSPIEFSRFILRYEDLAADSEKWFREILKFYSIPIDESRFADALILTNFRNLQALEDLTGYRNKSEFQGRFFRCGTAGAWRDVLTKAQARKIEAQHGEAMAEYGYGDQEY